MNIIPYLMPRDILGIRRSISPFPWSNTIIYYSSGRAALLNGVKLLASSNDKTRELLVPSFICEEALWPLRDAGFKINYYSIDDKFGFSLEEIESKINANTLAVMIVHYFGIQVDLDGLKDLCINKGIYLIEDCAHSFCGEKTGTIADISFFSIRKFIPVHDGGALVVNNIIFQPKINQIRSTRNLGNGNMLKLVMRSILNLLRGRLRINNIEVAQKLSIEMLCPRADNNTERAGFKPKEGMSDLSRVILSRQDLKNIRYKRRENYNDLANKLKNMRGIVIPFPIAKDGWSPYVLPVFVEGKKQLTVLKALISNGIIASDWPTLPNDLSGSEKESAYQLMGRIILLPVHQRLSKNAPREISRIFIEALK
ncbi:DegT/DnrJ/EryC1/StrS family aminotransferase [Candidatus Saganbacteria bacterium]|nr:DegT/DnrJ/EryC1/StrS family aminotransferase [Candidatus Saganbacteria bacterium]